MIKIEFSGLSFQDEDFKDETFSEGFLIPAEDDVIPTKSEWNGDIYDVQYVIYNTYSVNSKYQSFQKIQYAPKINIFHESGKSFSAKVIEFEASKYLNEFWKIEMTIKNLDSKLVENVILTERIGMLYIASGYFYTNINLPVLDNIEFSQSIIDNFKDKITDYNKTSELKMIRFYLNSISLNTFYSAIEDINIFSIGYINIEDSIKYRQYLVKKEDIGNDLFEITLTLYKENRITV